MRDVRYGTIVEIFTVLFAQQYPVRTSRLQILEK